jgi:hypothetical protein
MNVCPAARWSILTIALVVSQLQVERERLEKELRGVSAALAAFGKVYGQGKAGRKRHAMSAAGRARIAAAQRKRWAKIRAAKKSN